MVQNRLIGALFLLAMSASLVGAPPALPRGTEMRSLLDDLAPSPSLKGLATMEGDFRGCDRDWNRVADFWTADVKNLYELKTSADVEDP